MYVDATLFSCVEHMPHLVEAQLYLIVHAVTQCHCH